MSALRDSLPHRSGPIITVHSISPDPVALARRRSGLPGQDASLAVAGSLARTACSTHPYRSPDGTHRTAGIHFQHVLHRAHEGSVLLWRDTPHLLSPRLGLFFSAHRLVRYRRTARRRFNSSQSICSVHRFRLDRRVLTSSRPMRLAFAIQHRCPLAAPLAAFQRSREAVLSLRTFSRLWSRCPLSPCRVVQACSPLPTAGSAHSAVGRPLPSVFTNRVNSSRSSALRQDHVEFHFHPLESPR